MTQRKLLTLSLLASAFLVHFLCDRSSRVRSPVSTLQPLYLDLLAVSAAQVLPAENNAAPLPLSSGDGPLPDHARTVLGKSEVSENDTNPLSKSRAIRSPFGIEPTDDGFYWVSYDEHLIQYYDRKSETITRVAGTGQSSPPSPTDQGKVATAVSLNQPHEVRVDSSENVYITDTYNHRIGMVTKSDGKWKTIAGTGAPGFSGDGGLAVDAQLNGPHSIAISGNLLFIADLMNHRIRSVDLKSGIIQSVAGNGEKKIPVDGTKAFEQGLFGPRSLAVDDTYLWIALREGNSVWKLERSSGRVFHVAGNGRPGNSIPGEKASTASLNGPKGIAVEPGKWLFIADTENHAVRRISLSSGMIEAVIGSDKGERGLLARPHGVSVSRSWGLLIGDSENNRIVQVDL